MTTDADLIMTFEEEVHGHAVWLECTRCEAATGKDSGNVREADLDASRDALMRRMTELRAVVEAAKDVSMMTSGRGKAITSLRLAITRLAFSEVKR